MYTIDDFMPFVGQTVTFEDGAQALTLRTCEPTAGAPPNAERESFILIFTGPPGPGYMREGMKQARAGDATWDIYVSPIQTHAPDRQDYQAIFN